MPDRELNYESFEVSGKEWHVLRRSTLKAKDLLESVAFTRFALDSATKITNLFCPSVARKASHSLFNVADQWSAFLLERGVLTIHDYRQREENLLDTCSVLSANVARLRTNVAETTQDKAAVSAQVLQLKDNIARLQQMTQAAERSREVAEAARGQAELQLVREQLGLAQARERIRVLEGVVAAAAKQPLEASDKASGSDLSGSISGSSGSAGSSASDGSCLDDSFELEPLHHEDDNRQADTDDEEDEEDEEVSLVGMEHHHHHLPATATARAEIPQQI